MTDNPYLDHAQHILEGPTTDCGCGDIPCDDHDTTNDDLL